MRTMLHVPAFSKTDNFWQRKISTLACRARNLVSGPGAGRNVYIYILKVIYLFFFLSFSIENMFIISYYMGHHKKG